MFILKRGIFQSRQGLRQFAFGLMFMAVIKLFIFDVRMAKRDILCATTKSIHEWGCSHLGLKIADVVGLVLLIISCAVLFWAYKKFAPMERKGRLRPEDVRLRFWANLALVSVSTLVVLQSAPWVGYLTVGYVPDFFNLIPWQGLSLMNLALLLTGFWKAESCTWVRDDKATKRDRNFSHAHNAWTPRDTLWMSVMIFLVTLALAYVAQDVLTLHETFNFRN